MRHDHVSQRLIAKAEVELAKYGYHWALAMGGRARPRSLPRGGVRRVDAPAEVRALYRRGELHPGDLVEGYGMLSPFSSLYKPRAYYPEYLLSQMPAVGDELAVSPRIRPALRFPRLGDGRGIAFLYPRGKRVLERRSFPGDLREALTRDYDQVPVVASGDGDPWTGLCRWRARLERLSDADARKLGGVAGPLYGTMEERGLTLFLSAEGAECRVEPLPAGSHEPLFGSLFLEARITGERADEHLRGALTDELRGAVEKVFGFAGPAAVEETQVMSRLLAIIRPPVIAVQRAPHLLSLFLPCDLAGDLEGCARTFEFFAEALIAALRRNTEGHGHVLDAEIDFAYDCRREFFRKRRAMRTGLLDEVVRRRPHLASVRDWLTGS